METVEVTNKVKHTIDEILEFSEIAFQHLNSSKEENKLTYALKRLAGDPNSSKRGSLFNTLKEYQNKRTNLMIDLAATDPTTGVLLVDQRGQYSYTPENRKALNVKLEELLNEVYDIEPFYVTEFDFEKLTPAEKEAFKDFVIK